MVRRQKITKQPMLTWKQTIARRRINFDRAWCALLGIATYHELVEWCRQQNVTAPEPESVSDVLPDVSTTDESQTTSATPDDPDNDAGFVAAHVSVKSYAFDELLSDEKLATIFEDAKKLSACGEYVWLQSVYESCSKPDPRIVARLFEIWSNINEIDKVQIASTLGVAQHSQDIWPRPFIDTPIDGYIIADLEEFETGALERAADLAVRLEKHGLLEDDRGTASEHVADSFDPGLHARLQEEHERAAAVADAAMTNLGFQAESDDADFEMVSVDAVSVKKSRRLKNKNQD